LRWDPFREMSPLRLMGQRTFVPDFDIKETKDAFVVTADVPGVKPDELEVKVQQNLLTVSGSRKEERVEEGETYYSFERSYGGFTRSFTLPESADPDRVSASLKEGVLKLSIPKRPGTEAKRIKVQGS
jgi:HSP20 family protein